MSQRDRLAIGANRPHRPRDVGCDGKCGLGDLRFVWVLRPGQAGDQEPRGSVIHVAGCITDHPSRPW
jgi:hypothetical protein